LHLKIYTRAILCLTGVATGSLVLSWRLELDSTRAGCQIIPDYSLAPGTRFYLEAVLRSRLNFSGKPPLEPALALTSSARSHGDFVSSELFSSTGP